MNNNFQVTKASGVQEDFHKNKFCDSLEKAGAPKPIIDEICEKVSQEILAGESTTEIFRRASEYLARQNPEAAARYSLKRGIAELGPAGFIFEHFVEVVLQSLDYSTQRNQIMQGGCVPHEIDVLAKKDGIHCLIEAKYHNSKGIKTHVDVVMYAYARLQDIEDKKNKEESEKNKHQMWLFTNTKFTRQAIKYAKCKNIRLTGWDYPHGESLEELISRNALYPVSVLPSVDKHLLEIFAKFDMMLARDLAPYKVADLTKKFGIDEKSAEKVIKEAYALVYGDEEKREF
jgi:hypothetical protein